MKVIVVGAGKVGHTIAESLSSDNDVTIIDKNEDVLRKIEDTLDVLCIKGNGNSVKVLLEAGAENADLLVAVTDRDELNMVCSLTAKRLGTKNIGARIRDTQYAKELLMLKEELDLDIVINPELSTADEIANTLKFPFILCMEDFAKGKVKMAGLKVTPDMAVVGSKLKDIGLYMQYSAIVGAVVRDDEVILPSGDFEIKENDVMYLIGKASSILGFCKSSGKQHEKGSNAMILGGGRIGCYLANYLSDMGMKVNIIEQDQERYEELSERLPDVNVINADGTDEEVLTSNRIKDMDVFVAVTGIDEENIMASLLAKQKGVERIITKISRTNYVNVAKKLGIDNIVCPKLITANQILKFANSNKIESLYRIVEGQAEIIEFTAGEYNGLINTPIKSLNLPENTIIATIMRRNQVVIPFGNDTIKKSDRVIIITKQRNLNFFNELLRKASGGLQNELRSSIKKLGDIIDI